MEWLAAYITSVPLNDDDEIIRLDKVNLLCFQFFNCIIYLLKLDLFRAFLLSDVPSDANTPGKFLRVQRHIQVELCMKFSSSLEEKM